MTHDTAYVASILVVDDTIENLRLLANMLGAQGYEVRPVTNGRQALLAVEHDPPDLILLDINMPGMTGYEVCQHLKAREQSRDVPVIFLTALTDTIDKVKAFDIGGVDYVTKPFQFDEVLARVRTHVALRRAQVALSESLARLQTLERLRDDLVHMVVHDMKSPLTVLFGTLAFMRERSEPWLQGEAAEDLQAAINAAEGLNRMTNDLLDVSRLEAGKMPIERAACDLAVVARDVSAVMGRMERQRRIDVEADGAAEISCDGAIVRRVIENLVSNAIKYAPEGSAVRIAVSTASGSARVAVHDSGPGVPVASRARIFEKFGTIEGRKHRTYHSAGLGLAFCKLAVEAHGGTIGIADGVPKGSTFWFELPAGVVSDVAISG